jgi:hypothetical protein
MKNNKWDGINPLFCHASPRNIPEVREALDTIPCDKLIVKYMSEPEAYTFMRNFFLAKKDYTHMILASDDIIATAEVFKILMDDLAENPFYPVFSGIMNIDYHHKHIFNVCEDIDENTKQFTEIDTQYPYNWLPIMDWPNIRQVEYVGFSFTFIKRAVVNLIPFRGINGLDLWFCIDCKKLRIPIWIDPNARMLHLKGKEGTSGLLVGQKPSRVIYDKCIGGPTIVPEMFNLNPRPS